MTNPRIGNHPAHSVPDEFAIRTLHIERIEVLDGTFVVRSSNLPAHSEYEARIETELAALNLAWPVTSPDTPIAIRVTTAEPLKAAD